MSFFNTYAVRNLTEKPDTYYRKHVLRILYCHVFILKNGFGSNQSGKGQEGQTKKDI